MNKCNACGYEIKENGVGCELTQGRCPHRTPMLTDYHFRYYNLVQWIKGIFKR